MTLLEQLEAVTTREACQELLKGRSKKELLAISEQSKTYLLASYNKERLLAGLEQHFIGRRLASAAIQGLKLS